MQQFFHELEKSTSGRRLYDITEDIRMWVINENYDGDVLVDLESFFARLVVDGDSHFIHTTEGPDDMPAHIRTALTQTSLSIPVKNKRALLGQWQGIFIYEHRYGEFNRRVNLHLIGE